MPRRKPASAKQKKAALQEKRAVKRGDIPPPEPSRPDPRKRKRGFNGRQALQSPSNAADVAAARKLQSAFVKVSPAFLEETKVLASTEPLPRPLPPNAAIFDEEQWARDAAHLEEFTCPKRPKWRFDMSKKEVEKNEEGLFKKWLVHTDDLVERWCNPPSPPAQEEGSGDENSEEKQEDAPPTISRAPTHFERNLEVWRQLWRVTEISQVLLVLLDSRCPSLHLPPSLSSYLASTGCKLILVLTKLDICGPARADAWTAHLRSLHPDAKVVRVEAYAPAPDAADPTIDAQTKRRARDPALPLPFRASLVEALREAHAELLEPPERIRDDPEKVARWKPPVRRDINWDAVLSAHGGKVGHVVGGALAPRATNDEDDQGSAAETEGNGEPEYLTIGLIGQPNVGKSSLLNALFGTQKVRASRTPGKTKHFQTLFWTPEVRLVDCPGLVLPAYTPMETQVLSGILPISRVSAVPACIHAAARLLPLEHILRLVHPSVHDPPEVDKRTWRDGTRPKDASAGAKGTVWTAMDILTAHANKKGWVTAKAGRPDVNRAGNAILRALAEGRTRWAFWPPSADLDTAAADLGHGIWIESEEAGMTDEDSVDGEEDEKLLDTNSDEDGRSEDEEGDDVSEEEADEEEEEEAAATGKRNQTHVAASTGGRFGALAVDDGSDDEEGDNEESE